MEPSLSTYLPQDRRQALATGNELPEHTRGAALFADIAGFTPLTEALDRALGHRRGAEEVTRQLNRIYTALIAEVDRCGGSVIDFAGDSITCWFDQSLVLGPLSVASADRVEASHNGQRTTDNGLVTARVAVRCALAMQAAMRQFAAITLPGGTITALALKVAVASGPARHFVVGDPSIQLLDVLAGAPLMRAAAGEHLARPGEVLIDEATAAALGDSAQLAEWRVDVETGERFVAASELKIENAELRSSGMNQHLSQFSILHSQLLKPWLLPAVFERHAAGLGDFLTELRPAVALFLRFTGIDFDGDPAARAQLDALVCLVQRTLARHEGALLQITIGDKGSYLYVVFGAPSAHEDDPRRAVVAALELRDVLMARNDLEIQVGISRGVMRAGAYGGATRQTYGVLGDDVNLAARLMTLAEPNEVLISGRVQSAIGAEFALEPRAPIRLKGKAEPLPVFAVVGYSQRRAIRLEEPTYTLPMVGREAELGVIAQRLDQALKGQGQVVGIVAEAGMGKSRLLAEAIRLARRKGMQGYGGACQSSGTNTSYLVWGAIWRAVFDLDPAAPIRRQLRAIEGLIEEWAPARLEALPLLGPLLGLDLPENDLTRTLDARSRKSALHALLLDCLRSAAREAAQESSGLLLVLEDLHWIDPLSHDLLEQIAEAIVELPMLIVLAYRPPELLRLQSPRVEALNHFTRVALRDLSAADAEQLIRAKLAQLFPERSGAISAALIARITARAQGNPFYAEELLNYLHDRGIDPQDSAALAALDLPSSLHTLILSRIDQLSARQQATLKVASVIGRRFLHAWLHGAYPLLGAPEPLKADLQELAKLELTPLDTPEPELAYLFKHVVTQEVAYESLTVQARASLHEQLAAYLERLAGDDTERFVDLLAFHYERSDNLEKKCSYLRRAGEVANARSAFQTAADYLSRAVAWAEVAGDVGLVADNEALWARALMNFGRRAAADSHLARALDLARAAHRADLEQEILLQWADNTYCQGDYAGGHALLSEALALARARGDRSGEGWVRGGMGDLGKKIGLYPEARVSLEQSIALTRAIGDRFIEVYGLQNMATLLAAVGEYERALDYATQAQALAQAIGEHLMYAVVPMIIGHALAGLARWEEAAAAYRQSYDLLRAIDRPSFAIEALAGLARVSLAQGDVAAALAHIEQILAELAVEDREYYEEPLRIDLTCYQVLRAANDPRAASVLATAHAKLQEQAAKLTDEAMRRSFLENVPYHREIVAAWAEAQEQHRAE